MGRGARMPFVGFDPDAILYRGKRDGRLYEVKPCGNARKYLYVRMHGFPHFHRRAAQSFMTRVQKVRNA